MVSLLLGSPLLPNYSVAVVAEKVQKTGRIISLVSVKWHQFLETHRLKLHGAVFKLNTG